LQLQTERQDNILTSISSTLADTSLWQTVICSFPGHLSVYTRNKTETMLSVSHPWTQTHRRLFCILWPWPRPV